MSGVLLSQEFNVLDIRSGEHRGASPLSGKNVKSISNSVVRDHFFHCNYLPFFRKRTTLFNLKQDMFCEFTNSHL